jgi:hypothetical protein
VHKVRRGARNDCLFTMPTGCLLQVIDADNSCLFNAVGYVMESGNRRSADRLRWGCQGATP